MEDIIYDLQRDQLAEDNSGIYGTIYNAEELICDTFELPWKENIKNESCIPTGIYDCEVVYTRRFGRVILVKDVPNRTDIVFHVGNTAADTRGCILVGRYRQYAGIRDSRAAMGDILIEAPDRFRLNITGLQ